MYGYAHIDYSVSFQESTMPLLGFDSKGGCDFYILAENIPQNINTQGLISFGRVNKNYIITN